MGKLVDLDEVRQAKAMKEELTGQLVQYCRDFSMDVIEDVFTRVPGMADRLKTEEWAFLARVIEVHYLQRLVAEIADED